MHKLNTYLFHWGTLLTHTILGHDCHRQSLLQPGLIGRCDHLYDSTQQNRRLCKKYSELSDCLQFCWVESLKWSHCPTQLNWTKQFCSVESRQAMWSRLYMPFKIKYFAHIQDTIVLHKCMQCISDRPIFGIPSAYILVVRSWRIINTRSHFVINHHPYYYQMAQHRCLTLTNFCTTAQFRVLHSS